ncbi:cytochrome c [Occallatibacter riparius]|uniref:C-type cytochrome n=1 Tax=Occallatibacter riparius TaxID=1002689 RepID=A0A9J7BWI5_9BACT|nr:c-type cytochrome [Occallatibacter riparius]UWZ85238.1 c-type cytochrome [Occallatibacter riparius]
MPEVSFRTDIILQFRSIDSSGVVPFDVVEGQRRMLCVARHTHHNSQIKGRGQEIGCLGEAMGPVQKWMSRIWLSVAVVTVVLFASGCSANKKPTKLETALANAAKDVVIPLEAKGLKNPFPASEANIQAGKQIYLQQCALCHAADGHAETKLGLAMYPPAMDLNSPHVQRWSDAELLWITQNGVRLTGMPAWQTIMSQDDTWKVVDFIRALPKEASIRAAASGKEAVAPKSQPELINYGRELYRQEGCMGCHQLDGEGGKVGPELTIEGTRGRSDDWLVGHFKDPSAYTPGSVMPSFNRLTDDQLRALTVFLQSEKGSEPK